MCPNAAECGQWYYTPYFESWCYYLEFYMFTLENLHSSLRLDFSHLYQFIQLSDNEVDLNLLVELSYLHFLLFL